MDMNDKLVQFFIAEYKKNELDTIEASQKNSFGVSGLNKVRDGLIDALGRSNNEEAEDFLIEEYNKAKSHEKNRFYQALGLVGGDKSAEILIEAIGAEKNTSKKPYEALGMTASLVAIRYLLNEFKATTYPDEKVLILNALAIANK